MKTSVIGFPRVGTLRELKFASEKYFRKETGAEELLKEARRLRNTHWTVQKEAGIDYIPCNDFSFYDTVLDTAVLLGIVPKRYRELNLSALDTYFAMARGYQGESGDVKALAMKKWFNTNYHYIVPEVEDDTKIALVGEKLWEEYEEAKALGIETKPVLTGPYTLLKLCRYTGSKTADDFTDAVIAAYQQVLEKCAAHRIMWLQLDEPALVRDLSKEDIALFHKIYENILPCKKTVEILLQTYFGDVRDIYKDLTELPFDGIGLDFIEGKETVHLIEKYGFPKDKLLFAGLVNGKNIWRNHYDRTLNQLQQLTGKGIQTVLSTSCSLLHVPYTVKHETKLSEKYLDYFAFAEEKLSELKELSGFAENPSYTQESAYKKNSALFAADRDCKNAAVKKRLSEVTEKDYVRLPKRSERQQLQKETFHLPQFPTTTIGSFPQTKDVKQNRAAFRKGEITEQEYTAFNKKKIAECIKKQEEIGLDVLVHGEYERNDMVEYFGEALGGFLFTDRKSVV